MLATLLDRAAGDVLPLPGELTRRYGGPLRMTPGRPHVYANFVSTLDGIVSYDEPGVEAARHVSGGHSDDRFVLALLRAVADAVIVGAGTLRKEPDSIWTAASVVPELSAEFAELRRRLGRPPDPATIVVTRSGAVDRGLPAFRGPAPVMVVSGELTAAQIVERAARESGGGRILTEGGPNVLGQLLAERAVHEIFLTIAPRLAGRTAARRRLGLVEGSAFDPDGSPRGRLLSLKTADDYLFTRFAIGSDAAST